MELFWGVNRLMGRGGASPLTNCAIYSTIERYSELNEPIWTIRASGEFEDWYDSLQELEKSRVDARLDRLKCGHLGAWRFLGGGLYELKWKNGMRIYYSSRRDLDLLVILLWGGFKSRQRLDIDKARRLRGKYEQEYRHGTP